MLRQSVFAALGVTVAAAVAFAATPASAESSTIRIEPRPYYGAVVTVEQGVRVWRPLPPTRYMIINPTNAPVSVNVADIRETVTHQGAPYAAPYANSYVGGAPRYAVPGYFGGRRNGIRHGRPAFRSRH